MLSDKTKEIMIVALANKVAGQELAQAIDAASEAAEAGANPVASHVAALGATSNLSAAVVTATVIANSNFTAAVAGEPTKAEIDAGINTLKTAVVSALDLKADNADLETMRTQAEARLDAIEAKVDALLAALVAAGLMA